jgi:predicted  nucleic acid-binding Zn-ribbon protein
MLADLRLILDIQDLDIKMIRLMKLRKERLKELKNLQKVKEDLREKQKAKEVEIFEQKKMIKLNEGELQEIQEKAKKLESQQHSVKKVDEFNALNQEMAAVERDRVNREQKLSDLIDKVSQEEDLLQSLKDTWETTFSNSRQQEFEILEKLKEINEEGRGLKIERDRMVKDAEPETFSIYERLLQNKKDRVVVPIENRVCTGCHILVTAQDENLVRKGERLVFCEHCSRIQYWPEETAPTGEDTKPTRRRRTPSATV